MAIQATSTQSRGQLTIQELASHIIPIRAKAGKATLLLRGVRQVAVRLHGLRAVHQHRDPEGTTGKQNIKHL